MRHQVRGANVNATGITIPPWTGRRRADALTTARSRGALHLPCSICGQEIDTRCATPTRADAASSTSRAASSTPSSPWDPVNWAPARLDCNQSAGDGTNAATNGQLGRITPLWDTNPTAQAGATQRRVVVLLCGPPGAGKTTIARQAPGLTIYDRDDPLWDNDTDFTAALTRLGRTPTAGAGIPLAESLI